MVWVVLIGDARLIVGPTLIFKVSSNLDDSMNGIMLSKKNRGGGSWNWLGLGKVRVFTMHYFPTVL